MGCLRSPICPLGDHVPPPPALNRYKQGFPVAPVIFGKSVEKPRHCLVLVSTILAQHTEVAPGSSFRTPNHKLWTILSCGFRVDKLEHTRIRACESCANPASAA